MRRISIAVLSLLLVAVFSPAYAGWVKSTNAPVIPTGQGLNGVNALYFVNADTGFGVGFRGGVYKTTDGLRSVQQLPLPLGRRVDLYSVCFLNSQEGWAGADGIIHTIDGAMNWEKEDVPELEPFTLFAGDIVGDEIWFGGWYNEQNYPNTHGILMRRSIYGGPWSVTKLPQFGGFFGIKVITPNNVWLTGTNTVVQTTDRGQTFIDQSEGVRDAEVHFKQIAFNKQNSQLGYLVGNRLDIWGGRFYITTDGGLNWVWRKSWGDEMQAQGLALSNTTIYVAGGDAGYAYDVGVILSSTDDGTTWREAVRGTVKNSSFHGRIFQLDDTHMWTAWRDFWYFDPNAPEQLFVSVLDTWKATIASRESHQIPLTESASQLSPIFRLLEAPKWAKIDTLTGVITGVPANSDIGRSKIIVQVTLSNGQTDTKTIELEVSPPVTAVEEEEVAGIPSHFDLSQNYPNPFNPETMIDYSLSEESDVRLSVFDLLGQELILLVSEKQLPGFYSVKFTAANLPSGSYILRLTAGGAVQTRKMTIIR